MRRLFNWFGWALPKQLVLDTRTAHEGERCTPFELTFFEKNCCPDCGKEGFLAGPRGGLSENIKCSNPQCGSQFNFMGPFGIERISNVSPDKQRLRNTTPYRD